MCRKSIEESAAGYIGWKLDSEGGFWDGEDLAMLDAAIREEGESGESENGA